MLPQAESGVAARPESYDDAAAWLKERYPQIASGLLFALPDREPGLDATARRVFEASSRKCAAEGRPMSAALEGVARMSFEFLRLQARFVRDGRYREQDGAGLFERLYSRPDVMEGYYLDGLLLTYAFWVNHVRLLQFYREQFVEPLGSSPRMIEIGVGHGLMALTALQARRDLSYDGIDVSPSALRYAAALLAANGIDPARTRLQKGDALRAVTWPGAGYDAAVCCEVLEHVERPEEVLAGLFSALAPGGRAFLTTVANVAAEDHIFLFHDVDHVRRVLTESGLEVLEERALVLRGFEASTPLPLNYAAIVQRRGQ